MLYFDFVYSLARTTAVTPVTPGPGSFRCLQQSGLFPHEIDCDRYYDCRNYIWTIQLCASGQLFSIRLSGGVQSGECLPASQVFCGGTESLFIPNDQKIKCYCHDFLYSLARTTVVTPGTASFRCPQHSGLFPHETDCDKYYFCQQFQSSILTCRSGELFSVSSSGIDGRCSPAGQVFCGGRFLMFITRC